MSEMTQCNYCTLKRVRADAKKSGIKVEVKPGTGDWNGWTVVYENGRVTHYFMELSKSCVC